MFCRIKKKWTSLNKADKHSLPHGAYILDGHCDNEGRNQHLPIQEHSIQNEAMQEGPSYPMQRGAGSWLVHK